MLAKVVKTWPNLLSFGTIPCSTTEAPVSAVLRHNFVNTLFVSIEIIVGTETVTLRASENFAFERLLMSEGVFPGNLLPTEETTE